MNHRRTIGRRGFLQAGTAGALAAIAATVGPTTAHAAPVPVPGHPFTPNTALVDAFLARRGGPIGTGGKPAVAFRCDHHLNQFQSRLLPLHRRYDIPVTIAAMSRIFATETETGTAGSGQLSFPLLQRLALENGLEVAHHGATHTDAPTPQRLREEIVHSRLALAAALPELPVELFIPPGVGGTNYQGFHGGRSQGAFGQFLAGRLIMQEHALSTGYVPGYWPMTGNPLDSVGTVHVGLDTAAYARRGPSFVAAARSQGRGVCFMYHPNLIDDADLQAIEALFAWCARERDAGRLEVLTTSGLMAADFTGTARHNLLSGAAGFRAGWNGWNGVAARWALRRDGGVAYARRGAASASLSKEVATGVHAGSARQLRIPVRTTTGLRLRIEVADAASAGQFRVQKTVTLPPSSQFLPLHQYVILPLAGAPRIRVSVTALSGGELHVQEPELLAA